MAIETGTKTLAVRTQERTWRLELFTDKGTEPTVRVHRETIMLGPDGEVFTRVQGIQVNRALSEVADQSFKIGKETYTGAEIATVLAGVADIWRQEDIAAAAQAQATADAEANAALEK